MQNFFDISMAFLHQPGQDRRPTHDIFPGVVGIDPIFFGSALFQLHQAIASPSSRLCLRVISLFDGADRLNEVRRNLIALGGFLDVVPVLLLEVKVAYSGSADGPRLGKGGGG